MLPGGGSDYAGFFLEVEGARELAAWRAKALAEFAQQSFLAHHPVAGVRQAGGLARNLQRGGLGRHLPHGRRLRGGIQPQRRHQLCRSRRPEFRRPPAKHHGGNMRSPPRGIRKAHLPASIWPSSTRSTGAACATPPATTLCEKALRSQGSARQCQNSATQATGYIPGAQTASAQPAQPQVGGRAKGAAKGAAIGAVAGEVQGNQYSRVPDAVQDEYRGNQAGTGAAVGTVAGGMNQRQDRRQSKAEAQKAAQAQAQKATAWQNSYAGCLQARGYSLN